MKREYTARIGSREFKVSNIGINGDIVNFDILGNRYAVTLEEERTVSTATRSAIGNAAPRSSASRVVVSAPVAAAHPGALIAPISGIVVSLQVTAGSKVEAGQVIAVLEAMKMENPIKSDRSGIIKTIHVQAGAQVRTGEPIVSFE